MKQMKEVMMIAALTSVIFLGTVRVMAATFTSAAEVHAVLTK